MLDLFVDFDALVAHGGPFEPEPRQPLLVASWVSTAGMGICSPASTNRVQRGDERRRGAVKKLRLEGEKIDMAPRFGGGPFVVLGPCSGGRLSIIFTKAVVR
jgi:hypothetical protein